jgi:membrane protein DedA with SNARE-associated domain
MNLFPNPAAAALASGIIAAAFISEDGAIVTAATLASSSLLNAKLAFVSAFSGLWVGDLGVYAIARYLEPAARDSRWCSRIFHTVSGKAATDAGDAWQLAISRFFPGTRLPSYVSAGLRGMPLSLFSIITAATAFLWTLLVFALIRLAPERTQQTTQGLSIAVLLGITVLGGLYAWRIWGEMIRAQVRKQFSRFARWEFWPGWIFYPPVAAYCCWLGLRHRSFALAAIANLNQKNGGIIGESKIGILQELMETAPEVTAESYLVPEGPTRERVARIENLCAAHNITAPFVLKPNAAQRGAGFKKVNDISEVQVYLSRVRVPLVLQRYVAGPKEAGIFYYRFPGEPKGHILGITRKEFPFVIGNGAGTIRELIEADQRARLIAHTYLKRFGAEADRVPGAGERVRLVEAGNHCQGCEFRDGSELCTTKLLQAFDAISQRLCGFYVGRFDVRYSDDDELREGKNFQIIELNGAASEATNIYDSRNSLWSAYRTLFRQWGIVYAIGAANRERGFRPPSPCAVWRDWREFAAQACEFPLAD